MPTIPKRDLNSVVKVSPAANPYQSYANDSRAFGGGLGGAIEKTGDQFAEIGYAELAKQNETRAKEIDVEFSQNLRALQYAPGSGYYTKRGRDAFEYQPLFEQSVEELRKTAMEKAENESQRLMLDKVIAQRVAKAKGGVARHSMKEYQAWQDSASVSRANDTVQEAIVNYNDEVYIKQLKASGRNEIIDLGQRQGKDGEQINADLKDYESKIHVGTINHLIQIDTEQARAYYEANKDEIDGREQSKLLRSLKIAEKGDMATDRGHYAALNKMAATSSEEFINEDLAKYTLSDADFKGMSNLQRTMQLNQSKAQQKITPIRKAMLLSSNALKSAGIDTTPKEGSKDAEQLNEFQGALLMELDAFRKENGREANEQEMLGIIDSLLIIGKEADSGWFSTNFRADEVFLFEADNKLIVPDEEVDKIKEAYRKNKGREPTEVEIQQLYMQKQMSEARGKY